MSAVSRRPCRRRRPADRPPGAGGAGQEAWVSPSCCSRAGGRASIAALAEGGGARSAWKRAGRVSLAVLAGAGWRVAAVPGGWPLAVLQFFATNWWPRSEARHYRRFCRARPGVLPVPGATLPIRLRGADAGRLGYNPAGAAGGGAGVVSPRSRPTLVFLAVIAVLLGRRS